MKILIVYDTKRGTTTQICRWIKEGVSENNTVDICRVSEAKSLDYDLIVVGSPIYFNRLMRSVVEFLKRNELKGRKIVPFVVSLRRKDVYLEKLRNHISKPIDGKVLGGKFIFSRMNKKECVEFGKKLLSI